MDFNDFYQKALKVKNLPLPGADSHYKMTPHIRLKELRSIEIEKNNPKKAGVMALFYPNKEYNVNLLFILRKKYPGVHSNQVGFPGGKKEKTDKDLFQTALRETSEEVGVPGQSVEVMKELSEVYIPPSNFMVTPFLGIYKNPQPFILQESEVEQLIEVNFTDVIDDANLVQQNLTTSYAKNIEVPAFKLNGHIVWGATAMMLNEIKMLFKQVL
ncbi:MAG: CoA pyrophosphatase [Bacteroidota bacterium]